MKGSPRKGCRAGCDLGRRRQHGCLNEGQPPKGLQECRVVVRADASRVASMKGSPRKGCRLELRELRPVSDYEPQ